jgi:Tfp pilus assembly protein PilN
MKLSIDVASLFIGGGVVALAYILINIVKLFFRKKVANQEGIKQLKAKLEYASKELIEAVEHMKNTQKVHAEFYEIIMAILNK